MNLETFISEMSKLGYSLSEYQLNQFELYYALLTEWNEKINLTSIIEKEEVYLKHFYDSATVIKTLKIEKNLSMCDVGTGAGFPGIVIKILFPEIQITLLDSLLKRIKFLNIVIEKLELKKIITIHERVEDFAYKNREVYDYTIARAVAPLSILLEYCVPITKINGYFIAMKSNISQEIINSKKAMEKLDCFVEKIDEFNLPIENSIRNIILIKKIKKTYKDFPRKPNIIKNKPL
jgi:16S rRNA (guanine527-N7)-methyltransferase